MSILYCTNCTIRNIELRVNRAFNYRIECPRQQNAVLPTIESQSRAQKRQLPTPGWRETRRKKSGAGSKWRFNYNGRLITAIAHHEPSFSRNSRIIRARGTGRGRIVDFPADTLDTLENSSPFPLQVPCTSSPSLHPPSSHTYTKSALSAGSHSLMADFILLKSRTLNTYSSPLITGNVSSLRDCLRTSLTTRAGDEMQRRASGFKR